MTLALATRGYICLGRRMPAVFGPGPQLVDAQMMSPQVDGSGFVSDLAPSFVQGDELRPGIQGAAEPIPSTATPSPQVVEGQDIAPSVTAADEDD